MSSVDDLPPALPAMWRALKRGYQAEPRLLTISFALSLLAALPDALIALLFMLLANGVTAHDRKLVIGAMLGLAACAVATWFLRVISDRTQRRFRDRVTIALESHVAKLQASVQTIAHHERPDFLDRLAVLRDQVFVLDHMYMSLFSTCGWILRLGVTIVLLMSIHWSLVLLVVFALPTVLTSTWRPAVERAAEERGASANRLARHLFNTATTAPPGKEVRVTRIGERLVGTAPRGVAALVRAGRARRAGAARCGTRWVGRSSAPRTSARSYSCRRVSAAPRARCCWCWRPARGSRPTSAQRSARSASCAASGWTVRAASRGSRTTRRRISENADAAVPERLSSGIRFDHVSFAYPGTTRKVLDDVSLELQPGTVVAVVGENGAGKSTLVKLLCRLYQPTQGRILIDGVDLARIPADDWRERLAGAFQDFFRFEFQARHTVGVGDVPRLDDQPAVSVAVDRAGAADVVERLIDGLATQLGPDLARRRRGQLRPVAEARPRPRLHARPAVVAGARRTDRRARRRDRAHAVRTLRRSGARRVPWRRRSHRARRTAASPFSCRTASAPCVWPISSSCSTVAKLVEVGSHEALMAKGGQYAELYGIQAAAYR